jgi:hypothetical protein
LTFSGADYTLVFEIPDCELITVVLEELCGEGWTEIFSGTFTTYDVKFDKDLCSASVTPEPVDDYACLFESWTTDRVVSNAGDVVQLHPFGGDYFSGNQCCTALVPIGDYSDEPVCDVPAGWCFEKSVQQNVIDGLGNEVWMSCFHRITAEGTALDPPPFSSGWTLLSGTTWWRCPGEAGDINYGVLDNGRLFNDIIEYLFDQMGCGFTVRSHFFGINDTHDAPPTNAAYDFAALYCQALQVHQKSDVKRPYATNESQSFVWRMSLKKLLEDLETMMQVFFIIDGTDVILEHSTYFEAIEWMDASETDMAIKYEKAENSAPRREHFFFVDKDADVSVEFKAQRISYGNCGVGGVERTLNYFTNDIQYINDIANDAEIADTNFCLVASVLVDGQYSVIQDNEPMGWPALHENLHLWRRYFIEGTMNAAPTTFLGTLKTRELEPFSLPHCCDEVLTPTGYIVTSVGNADVQKVTKDYFADRITIEANI